MPPVLAVDIPSGLHADTGAVMGIGIHAAATVSFIGLKQGLFTSQGPDHCGDVVFDALGVADDVYTEVPATALLYAGQDLAQQLPPRPRSAHKGTHGHVLIIGGNHGMAGRCAYGRRSGCTLWCGFNQHRHAP